MKCLLFFLFLVNAHSYGKSYADNDFSFDPLDCCNIEKFIRQEWRSECDFKLKWSENDRFTVVDPSEPVTTNTERSRSLKYSDIKIVPLSCEQENCVFSKLNIISNGVVDMKAFSELLDNMTNKYPEWSEAKKNVLAICRKIHTTGYDGDCDINKILACTFDVLSENCPYENKRDPCKNSTSVTDGITCQISSSKYRPKSRRQFCNLPDLVTPEVRSECGVYLIYKVKYVPPPAAKSNYWNDKKNCEELTESTKCLLKKMNVLDNYDFIDRLKMRVNISLYARDFPIEFAYMFHDVFIRPSLYRDHCITPRKLLNLIDSMFMSCPYEKLKKDKECINLINSIRGVSDLNNFYREYPKLKNYTRKNACRKPAANRSSYRNVLMFDFGILSSDNIPPVKIINVKPTQ